MDKCSTTSNHSKEDDEYTKKYDFKYIDGGPDTQKASWRIGNRYYALDVSMLSWLMQISVL